MAPSPSGHGPGRRLAAVLACFMVVLVAVFPASACGVTPPASQSAAAAGTSADGAQPSVDATATGDQPDPRVSVRARVAPAPTVSIAAEGTLTWAFLDRTTGTRYQSANADVTSSTESMVKAWLAADSLTRAANGGWEPDYDLLVPMIRDSDDDAAETVYWNNGGNASIERMISTCQLQDTEIYDGWWSLTMMSARDAVGLGECIADGTAAGAGTAWLLDEMRQVEGEGRFGVVDALTPDGAAGLAIKNGWTLHWDDDEWRVNCLAIDNEWVLAVMTRYPGELGLSYGSQLCAEVARQILGPDAD
jgi:hypothetical protein